MRPYPVPCGPRPRGLKTHRAQAATSLPSSPAAWLAPLAFDTPSRPLDRQEALAPGRAVG
jgi:hypothetical protein